VELPLVEGQGNDVSKEFKPEMRHTALISKLPRQIYGISITLQFVSH